jgi:hypothetical protein
MRQHVAFVLYNATYESATSRLFFVRERQRSGNRPKKLKRYFPEVFKDAFCSFGARRGAARIGVKN